MYVKTGYFADVPRHHQGWFKIYRFGGGRAWEIWVGHHWLAVDFGR